MGILQITLVAYVAMLHAGFMFLEMVLWDKASGRTVFRTTREFAKESKALAMNQGLYNGFLAAGLIWGLLSDTAGNQIILFFLCCVIAAGIFGAATVNLRIFWIQAFPALIALLSLLFL